MPGLRRSAVRLGLIVMAVAVLGGCQSFGSSPGDSGESVGLEVRNGLNLRLAIWIDGRILDFVPPFQTVCIRIPVPFQEGVLEITDNELPVRNSLSRTTRTRFETQSGWSIDVDIPIRTPLTPVASANCA
jgi:hypothetical protein